MSLVGWGSSAGVLLAIAVAAAQGTAVRPGQVNYIEGQVALEGKALTPGALEGVEVATGQTLSTEKGKAEVLLTPGVFLRLGEQAAVKMTSQSVSDTRVELVKGDAILEVVQPGVGRVLVVDGQARADVRKAGVYEFHANGAVAVMAGKARVEANDRTVERSGKPNRRGSDGDALYAWSRQRSQEDARASVNTAQALVGTDPANWKGAGWYWNPFYANWAFLPAAYVLSGPFGEEYFSARFYWEYAVADTHSHGYFTAAQ